VCVCVCVCVCVSLCVLLLFFSDCLMYLFSSLAARVFNKLTCYSLLVLGMVCGTQKLQILRILGIYSPLKARTLRDSYEILKVYGIFRVAFIGCS